MSVADKERRELEAWGRKHQLRTELDAELHGGENFIADRAALMAQLRTARLAEALARANRKAATESKLKWGADRTRRVGLNGWQWWVKDRITGELLASGWALTKRAVDRRRHRAYLRLLNPPPAVETSRLACRWKPWVN